jgi:hypothetical protein
MRTTIDLDVSLIQRAKRLALKERQTLSAIVNEALAIHLGSKRSAAPCDPPFELIVRGKKQGKFPSAATLLQIENEETFVALNIPALKRHSR